MHREIDSEDTMKRKYLWITLILCGVALVVFIISQNRMIGEVRGPEWDQIVIDDVVYYRENNNDFSRNDKGRFLGVVTDGKTRFRVYSVKGDTEGKWLYWTWDWEGAFYKSE